MALIFEDDAAMESVEVEAVFEWLQGLENQDRIASAVKLAAKFLEFGAYEMARTDTANKVAHLILLAADMERMSKTLENVIEVQK